jgi:glycosyltransferase involved in cell wall biosynthesis
LRVLILAPVHHYDDVRVFKKEALSLANNGYAVTLISRIEKKAIIDGINVIPPSGSSNTRFLRFLSLPLVAIQVLKTNSDIYHLHNPDTIFISWILKLFRKKVIYDTHEDFSKRILIRHWIPRYLRMPLACLIGQSEKLTSKIVDQVVVTQPAVAKRLGDKCEIIENPPRINQAMMRYVYEQAKKIEITPKVFRLIYIGGISEARGLLDMVRALNLVNQHFLCRLWLIGPAVELDLKQAMNIPGWEYVDYFPRMKQEIAFAYIVNSDLGLIYIQDVGDHSITDPNKIYEYMVFKKPFIASNFRKWKIKLGKLHAGLFVSPGSADLLAKAIINLHDSEANVRHTMGCNGYDYVVDNSWEKEEVKLLQIYSDILK